MRPVVTVAEMRAADEAALAVVPEGVLVERAGWSVAVAAARLMGATYGRRVVVVAGKGNNGADGRVAGRVLARRGARVAVVEAGSSTGVPPCDLVIDAAYGTGFRGHYEPPPVAPGTRVLAVDIPSGVHGDTGAATGSPLRAEATVTMAALKTGLLQGDGAALAGTTEVADIGIPVGAVGVGLVEDADVRAMWRPRPPSAHKWQSAVAVVAGSPGMEGAAVMSARAAMRTGSGMVRLMVPGSPPRSERGTGPGGPPPSAAGPWPLEVVRVALPDHEWSSAVLEALGRVSALVIGPGLGRSEHTRAQVRRIVASTTVPTVVDADGLHALAPLEPGDLRGRPVVLTPHDGEFEVLGGAVPGSDRIGSARWLARSCGATVLLKGSLTTVAGPELSGWAGTGGPEVLVCNSGSPRLATAGTGDVLSGVIGGLLAAGFPIGMAGALGAHIHGRAAGLGRPVGLVAGDLPELVSTWLSEGMPSQGVPSQGMPAGPGGQLRGSGTR